MSYVIKCYNSNCHKGQETKAITVVICPENDNSLRNGVQKIYTLIEIISCHQMNCAITVLHILWAATSI